MKSVTNNLDFVVNNTLDNLSPTFISKSNTHGFGLFARDYIMKGELLGVLDGQTISLERWDEIRGNIKDGIPDYYQYFFMECNFIEEGIVLVRPIRTKYSYINHHRSPNLKIIKEPLSIVSTRDISSGEELFLDYRLESLPESYINGVKGEYL